jgi:hypothetical protein
MFGWLRKKDPKTELQRRYEALMREARDLQRGGDIVVYSAKVADADAVRQKLDALEIESHGS